MHSLESSLGKYSAEHCRDGLDTLEGLVETLIISFLWFGVLSHRC